MANPTTYFGWVMPTSSSLVTNLPADFNTFGQGVDTSLQDLLGGTTGQVLKKNSNTNMDFVWGSAPAAAKSYSLLNAGGTALTGSGTVTISGISGIDDLRIFILTGSSSVASATVQILLNADSGANYSYFTGYQSGSSTSYTGGTGQTSLGVGILSDSATSNTMVSAEINGANSSGVKMASFAGSSNAGGGANNAFIAGGGYWNNSATVSSVSVKVSTGNWDNGTVYVYGAA